MHILANHGWWLALEERLTPAALYRALEAGFGLVIPVRDCQGRLVIADGPPPPNALALSDFLSDRPVWPSKSIPLVLQIESNGLLPFLRRELANADGLSPCVVGMSAPEIVRYLDGFIPVFVRQSEHEPVPTLYELAEGVWIDSIERDWFDASLIQNHLYCGKHVTVVSSEINGRPAHDLWSSLKAFLDGPGKSLSSLQLCTNHPDQARTYFGD